MVAATFFQSVHTAPSCVADQVDPAHPNVVFILVDDLGYSDTTLFGTTDFYRTPNVQRLAARGMTFDRSYSSSPLCSPTRASILTGTSPARHGITSPTCHLPKLVLRPTVAKSAARNQKAIMPSSVTRLNTDYYTMAEMFRDNGYATGHFGKWHLGTDPYSPLQHGFDVDIPHWSGPGPAGSFVAPWRFPDFDPRTPNEHIEDRMADEAVDFIQANRNKPFFLNYWMFSVHAPFDGKPDLIEKYSQTADPDDPQHCPVYAAMIESMDDAIGTLIDAIDAAGLTENTIFVLASDNGGNMYNSVDGVVVTSNAPLRGGKATMYEGGVRGPAIVVVPGVVQAGSTSDEVIQSSDFYPTMLDLLDIAPQPDQIFDGITLTPALKGGSLNREAIFTYFPHMPKIPEWLPPSVSVHAGDYKLIRLFHQGDQGEHQYRLYNLVDDVAEQNDLSGEMPDLVVKLDEMIEVFLKDTGAVVPGINPKFDPAKYDPSTIGVGKLKPAKTRKS